MWTAYSEISSFQILVQPANTPTRLWTASHTQKKQEVSNNHLMHSGRWWMAAATLCFVLCTLFCCYCSCCNNVCTFHMHLQVWCRTANYNSFPIVFGAAVVGRCCCRLKALLIQFNVIAIELLEVLCVKFIQHKVHGKTLTPRATFMPFWNIECKFLQQWNEYVDVLRYINEHFVATNHFGIQALFLSVQLSIYRF